MRNLEFIAGFLTGLFFLAGRWSISRFYPVPLGYDQFIWISRLSTVALLFITLVFSPRAIEPTSRKEQFWTKIWLTSLYLPLSYLLLSTLWSIDNNLWAKKAFEILLITTICFCVYKWRLSNTYRQTLLLTIFGFAALLALLGLAFGSGEGGRMAVLAGGPNVLGRIMGGLLLIALYLFYNSRTSGPILKAAYVVIGLIGLLVLVLTGSRGALLATTVAVTFFVLLSGIKIRYILPIMAVTFLVVIGASFTPLAERAQTMFMKRVVNLTVHKQHTSGRDQIIERAIDVGMSSPIIGTGLNGFGSSLLGGDAYPHNFYVEFFAEGGTIGIILITVNTILTGVVFWKFKHRRSPIFASIGLMYLVAAQFSGDHFDNRNIFICQILALSQPLAFGMRPPNRAPQGHVAPAMRGQKSRPPIR